MAYVIFARWFALVSLFLSLGILFNLEDARDMAKSMIKTETGYIMGGVFPIIFGSLALVFVNSFSSGWSILVSLIGAIMVGIGLFRVFFVKRWKTLLLLLFVMTLIL